MNEELYAKARQLAKNLNSELEELRENKALELVDLLNDNPSSNIVYDWYQGTDPDLEYEVTKYIILSRVELLEFSTILGSGKHKPTNFHGYLRYNIITKLPIRKIRTELKTYELNRP